MIGNGAVSALSELAQHGWKSCVSGLGSSYSDSFHIEIEHKLNGLRPTRARLTPAQKAGRKLGRSEEHTSELQSLMRISYAVFCLKKKKTDTTQYHNTATDRKQMINTN